MIARKIAETSKHKVTSLAILKNFSSGKSFAFHEANLKAVGRNCEGVDEVETSIKLVDHSSKRSSRIRHTVKPKATGHPGL